MANLGHLSWLCPCLASCIPSPSGEAEKSLILGEHDLAKTKNINQCVINIILLLETKMQHFTSYQEDNELFPSQNQEKNKNKPQPNKQTNKLYREKMVKRLKIHTLCNMRQKVIKWKNANYKIRGRNNITTYPN